MPTYVELLDKLDPSHRPVTKCHWDEAYVYFTYDDGSVESVHKYFLLHPM